MMSDPKTTFAGSATRRDALLGLIPFETKKHHYLFSPSSGEIFEVTEATDLQFIEQSGTTNSELTDSIEPGASPGQTREAIQHELGHITFGVTQDCNLRCSYCVFGGQFENYRTHALQEMSQATALKAADYFLEHASSTAPLLFAAFYGGEPLLNLHLIKIVYAHLERALKDRIFFSITTNGTLLSREARDFVVANRIHINVSLDGDRATHDANRKLKNGRPTFDTIAKNLEKLRRADEDYFNRLVSFAVTITESSDYKKLDTFFGGYRNSIKCAPVLRYGSKSMEQTKGTTSNLDYLVEKFVEGCLTHAFDDPERRWKYNFAFSVLGRGFHMVHNRTVSDRISQRTRYLKKHCIPGASKLFVAPDGALFPCERLDSYRHLVIGHIDHGVNPDLSFRYLREYSTLRNTYCRSCYLIDICDQCFQSASDGREWNLEKMRYHCELARADFLAVLRLYASILEADQTAFDFLDETRGIERNLAIN